MLTGSSKKHLCCVASIFSVLNTLTSLLPPENLLAN
jgi:hypothetical protein